MNAKPYSIGLSLLSAISLSGCSGKTSKQYDIPVLLTSKLENAESILGKPRKVDSSPTLLGSSRYAYWTDPNDDYSVTISYSLLTQMPNMVAFGPQGSNAFTDKETILTRGNLKMDDPRYKLEFKFRPSDASKCYGVIATPTTP